MIRHHTVRVTGWIAVAISAFFVCFWAFWGAVENFHEGWYYRSFWMNVAMMLAQYLSPALMFALGAIIAVSRPRVGAALHVAVGLVAMVFFRSAPAAAMLIGLPVIGLGVLYWLGRARPKRAAYWLIGGLFVGVVVGFGASGAWRVAHRYDDGILDARVIEGNGVRLRWAPRGPGWPDDGATWEQAMRRCEALSDDGRVVEMEPRRVWRLPSVEETVRSMVSGGRNAGGIWDASAGKAYYATTPDKESPLWDAHSKIIYWWTSTSIDDKRAWRVVYNGSVYSTPKSAAWGYLGYRCVTEPR